MQDPEQQTAMLRLINERQDHVLEDLDRLNQRILNIIEVHTANRSNAGETDTKTQDAAA